MPRFRAVLFDLCDTLVHFDAERLPLVEIDNQPARTTAEAIYRTLGPPPKVTFDAFFACLKAVTAEIAAQRDLDYREVTSQERFRRVLGRLGLPSGPSETMQLVSAHMTRLAAALVMPAHHRDVLADLSDRYRLGIVTNFDHAPTVREILVRDGLDRYLDAVVISGDIGWRKPHRIMFETALKRLGASGRETLFVGDNFHLDVVGATEAGLAAAWYTRQQPDEPPDVPILSDLTELPALLDR